MFCSSIILNYIHISLDHYTHQHTVVQHHYYVNRTLTDNPQGTGICGLLHEDTSTLISIWVLISIWDPYGYNIHMNWGLYNEEEM